MTISRQSNGLRKFWILVLLKHFKWQPNLGSIILRFDKSCAPFCNSPLFNSSALQKSLREHPSIEFYINRILNIVFIVRWHIVAIQRKTKLSKWQVKLFLIQRQSNWENFWILLLPKRFKWSPNLGSINPPLKSSAPFWKSPSF